MAAEFNDLPYALTLRSRVLVCELVDEGEGCFRVSNVQIRPLAISTDGRAYQCEILGGEHKGKTLTISMELFECLPGGGWADGVPDNSKP